MKNQTLVQIVGQENVLDSDIMRKQYSKDLSFMPTQMPDAVVTPRDRDQVRQIIQAAAKANTPVVPVSSGPPHFHGATLPKCGGVILDLSKMDKIKNINRMDRVAMIEPGVRFATLQKALKKEGMRLPMPLMPHKDKSVIGSCLSREPHIMPKYHLDHSDPLLCNEVVFGTGDVFLTGEASGPGTIEEQHKANRFQKLAMGMQMNINRLIQGSQGAFGVVTWSTVKCEILPSIKLPHLIGANDVETLLEFSHWLVRRRLAGELFLINKVNFARLFADSSQFAALQESLPKFILFYCIEGYETLPEERVAYQEKEVGKIAGDLGLEPGFSLSGIEARQVMEAIEGKPQTSYWKLTEQGGCQDIPFISSFRALPGYLKIMEEQAQAHGFPLSRLGVHIQPVCQGHGHHCEFSLFYDPDSPEDRKNTKALYVSAANALMAQGAFFSRPFDLLSETVINRDAASKKALGKLKQIFDPHNIMNPGILGL